MSESYYHHTWKPIGRDGHLDSKALSWPLRARKVKPGERVLVQGDLFGSGLSNEEIAAVFGVMAATEQYTFLVLTEKPERAAEWYRWVETVAWPALHTEYQNSLGWPIDANAVYQFVDGHQEMNCPICGEYCRIHGDGDSPLWPLPNVHLGTIGNDQATADARIPHLLRCPAERRFVNYQPSGAVDFDGPVFYGPGWLRGWHGEARGSSGSEPEPEQVQNDSLDWLIISGAIGKNAAPTDLANVRGAVAQCRAAGVTVFVERLGARAFSVADRISFRGNTAKLPDGFYRYLADRHGSDPFEWPEDLRDAREFPAAVR